MVSLQIAHYRVIAKLGAGGMGEVYRARDEKLERNVALKLLPAETFRDAEARARLIQEARSAAALNHPHICTIHEVGEAGGQAYIAMELVEGQPLSDLLQRGGLPTTDVFRYGAQIADALSHAHERRIIHRDLKCGNVVITGGRAKVLDFGLAKRLRENELDEVTRSQASLTKPGTAVGTLAYMSPEQLHGQPADARSDIWSLGVVLYEMAGGARPFQGQTGFALSSAIMNQQPAPLASRVPAGLRAVIDRCLQKDPARRYQRASEVRAALEAIQTGAAAPWPAIRYTIARRRWLIAAGTAVVLLAVLVTANFQRIRTQFGTGAPRIQSLAVLPLENLTGDPGQAYLADGLHEALITDLSKLGGLQRVIARRSVLRFQKSDRPLSQIARELGVDGLITGSVLRSGSRVQVTTQLVNAQTEQQLWADRYERDLRDVLTLQNEIVSAITKKINLQLTSKEQQRLASRPPVNAEAYELYLKGRYHAGLSTPEGFEKGLTYLRQAVEKDSNPLFYSELALTYSKIGHETIPDAFDQAKAAARKALELDPASAQAYEVLAEIKLYSDWDDWPGAERNFQKALALNSNLGMAHRNYGWLLHLMGRTQPAIAEMQRATEIDPMFPLFRVDLAWQYWDLGQSAAAIEHARRSLELNPNFPYGFLLLALVHSEQGMHTEAIAAAQKAAQVDPELRWVLAQVYARAGRRESALKMIEEIKKQPSPMADWGLAQIYAVLGDPEQALFWLERGFDDRFSWMPWLRRPEAGLQRPFKAFVNSPRYRRLIRRMNLPE